MVLVSSTDDPPNPRSWYSTMRGSRVATITGAGAAATMTGAGTAATVAGAGAAATMTGAGATPTTTAAAGTLAPNVISRADAMSSFSKVFTLRYSPG